MPDITTMKECSSRNVLALDTSTSWESLAICKGDRLRAETHCDIPTSHSSHLMLNIDRLLTSLSMSIQDINLIAVSVGPGSFTGLRIGLTTAKTLAFGLDCPLIGVNSLEALAQGLLPLAPDNTLIVPILDARRSEVYSCSFLHSKGKLEQKTDIKASSIESVLDSLPENVIVCGTGTLSYNRQIEQALGKEKIVINERNLFPQALTIARMALEKYEKGQVDGVHTLKPLYIRPPDVRQNTTIWRKK